MRCSRCRGFVLEDGENTHCLLCGHYPLNVPYPEPVREPYSRKRKCYNCPALIEGEFKYCHACRENMRTYYQHTKKKATA